MKKNYRNVPIPKEPKEEIILNPSNMRNNILKQIEYP